MQRMTPNPFAIALTVLLLAMASAAVHAVPFNITTDDGDGADVGTSTENPNTNYGGDNGLRVNSDEAGANRGVAYLRFDIGEAVPSTISSPVFRFAFNAAGGSGDPGTFELWGMVDGTDADRRPADGGWQEGALVQANAPMKRVDTWSTTFYDVNDGATGNPSAYGIKLGEFTFNNTAAWTDDNIVTLGAVNSISAGSMSFSGANSQSIADNLLDLLQADTTGVVTLGVRQQTTNNRAMFIHSKERPDNVPGSFVPTLTFQADAANPGPGPGGTVDQITLGVAADTFVRRGWSQNFGGDGEILVKDNGGTPDTDRLGFVRFDLSSIDGIVEAAQLQLDVLDGPNENSVFRIHLVPDFHATEDFSELGLHWNNTSITDGSGDGFDNAAVINLGDFNIASGDTLALFSSQALIDYLNADVNDVFTLLIQRVDPQSNGTITRFASKDHPDFDGPRLVLDVRSAQAIVPEPMSMTLVALSVVGLVGRRRREVHG